MVVADKDRELGEAQAEIRALRLSERLQEKAFEEVILFQLHFLSSFFVNAWNICVFNLLFFSCLCFFYCNLLWSLSYDFAIDFSFLVFVEIRDLNADSNSFCLPDAGECSSEVNVLLSLLKSMDYPTRFAQNWKENDRCYTLQFIRRVQFYSGSFLDWFQLF